MDNKPSQQSVRPQLPEPTLRRLPWYLAYVTMLPPDEEYVSSTRLSRDLGVDASRIAKDLSFLGVKGKTRMGYNVAELENALTAFLDFTSRHRAVIIGAGSLGAALMRDNGLSQYGMEIVAGFDVNPSLIGTQVCDIPIYDVADLAAVQRSTGAPIAILTVPYQRSQQVADAAVAAGFKALWNFTPVRISAPDNIVIVNTSIYAHLALIYNRMNSAPDNQ